MRTRRTIVVCERRCGESREEREISTTSVRLATHALLCKDGRGRRRITNQFSRVPISRRSGKKRDKSKSGLTLPSGGKVSLGSLFNREPFAGPVRFPPRHARPRSRDLFPLLLGVFSRFIGTSCCRSRSSGRLSLEFHSWVSKSLCSC